ncbi:hypothetical protein Micbo1qcDRAFT_213677, partial [Microdochium bolleyi]
MLDTIANSTSLISQVFHLYRHISSARSFSDATSALSALIAVEYFRFESWVQASGLITKDPLSGEPVVHDHSLRRCILLAADANWTTMDYQTVEEAILGILSEVYKCLEKINKLRGNSRVATTLFRDATLQREQSRAVSFFRKVTFGWSLVDDTSDKAKLDETLKTLKDLNDRLESMLPSPNRCGNGAEVARRYISLKMLSVAAEPTELQSIGKIMAAQAGHVDLYQEIHTTAVLKAQRLGGGISDSELKEVVREKDILVGAEPLFQERQTRTFCKLQSDGSTVLKRIATLAVLLKLGGHPYFKTLPGCHGYIPYTSRRFGLVLPLPPWADPNREPVALFSLLPSISRYSLESFGMTKRVNLNALPTLEDRYRLAHAIADGLLSLLSVSW